MFNFLQSKDIQNLIKSNEMLLYKLGEAQEKIDRLEKQLKSRSSGPSYGEVAKDFDASRFYEELVDKVIKDFQPVLEQSALKLLKEAMKSTYKQQSPRMYGSVAYNLESAVHEFRFEIPRTSTSIVAMGY